MHFISRQKDINQWFPVVLALRNQTETKQNPILHPNESTTAEIGKFVKEYLKSNSFGVDFRQLMTYVGENCTPGSKIASSPINGF